MIGRTTQIHEPYAPWSARISLFALIMIIAAMLLHRLSVLTTPVAINLFGFSLILAALGFAIGLIAAASIWVRGRAGAWPAAWGLLIAAALWLWPLALIPTFLGLPKLNDITTDTANPPALAASASQRVPGANSVTYPGARFATQQARAYPDLRTLVIPRPVEEVYELTLDLVGGRRGLGWRVVTEEPPQTRPSRPGVIQAVDRTLILGFTDDISIRIAGGDTEARVDIRSASRYGPHDLGANAARIRRFMRDLSTRLDATGPVGVASRGGLKANRADLGANGLKRPLDRRPGTAASKREQDLAPADARRAPAQKDKPRG